MFCILISLQLQATSRPLWMKNMVDTLAKCHTYYSTVTHLTSLCLFPWIVNCFLLLWNYLSEFNETLDIPSLGSESKKDVFPMMQRLHSAKFWNHLWAPKPWSDFDEITDQLITLYLNHHPVLGIRNLYPTRCPRGLEMLTWLQCNFNQINAFKCPIDRIPTYFYSALSQWFYTPKFNQNWMKTRRRSRILS